MESRAEHHNKLDHVISKIGSSQNEDRQPTAISALSASTYSCGGEAGRLGGGGDEGTFGVPFGAGLKYRSKPEGFVVFCTSASSSVVGGDDSSELSLADISAL